MVSSQKPLAYNDSTITAVLPLLLSDRSPRTGPESNLEQFYTATHKAQLQLTAAMAAMMRASTVACSALQREPFFPHWSGWGRGLT